MDLLKTIFNEQAKLMDRVLVERLGTNIDDVMDDEGSRIRLIIDRNRAQIHEAMEMEDELPWKWWKDYKSNVDWEKVRIELIDELHFFMEKCRLAGLTPETITSIYLQKNNLNHQRQDRGYTDKMVNGVEDNHQIDAGVK